MTDKMIEKAIGFYDYNRIRHSAFCSEMQELITKILDNNKLSYNNISGRVKTRKSFIEKCRKDKYTHYNNITDIVGVRIITYLLSDVKSISTLIESEFFVDYNNSKDKADDLENNEFGYRGLHYILRLDEKRTVLSEYSSFSNMLFELPIKTLPQHAWSEMSHDRHYKFKGIMPNKISRQIYNAAALLERIDNDFQSISDELDVHLDDVTAKIKRGELDIVIDSTSLIRYSCIKFDTPKISKSFDGKDHEIIGEMLNYGITTIRDVDNIMPRDISSKLAGIKNYATNLVVFFRQIMIIHDNDRYFKSSWSGDWPDIRSQSRANLLKAYGIDIDLLKQRYLHDESDAAAAKISNGELNIDINVITLIRYAMIKFNTEKITKTLDCKNVRIFDEMKKYGLKSLQDLDVIIPHDIVLKINEIENYSTNIPKILRQIMIINDSEKFFEMCWSGAWPIMSGAMAKLLQAYNIDIPYLKAKYYIPTKN